MKIDYTLKVMQRTDGWYEGSLHLHSFNDVDPGKSKFHFRGKYDGGGFSTFCELGGPQEITIANYTILQRETLKQQTPPDQHFLFRFAAMATVGHGIETTKTALKRINREFETERNYLIESDLFELKLSKNLEAIEPKASLANV